MRDVASSTDSVFRPAFGFDLEPSSMICRRQPFGHRPRPDRFDSPPPPVPRGSHGMSTLQAMEDGKPASAARSPSVLFTVDAQQHPRRRGELRNASC